MTEYEALVLSVLSRTEWKAGDKILEEIQECLKSRNINNLKISLGLIYGICERFAGAGLIDRRKFEKIEYRLNEKGFRERVSGELYDEGEFDPDLFSVPV